jgi:hypothetical protein
VKLSIGIEKAAVSDFGNGCFFDVGVEEKI